MLGKLIKHEWLSTWKVPTILCIYLGILTILGCISFLSPMWKTDNFIIEIIAALSVMLYMLSLFAIGITVYVYFIIRFYRNMYTSEGYLTHTLPVKPWHHIFAKGFTYFSWMLISAVAMVCSAALIVITALSTVEGDMLYIVWEALQTEVMPEMNVMWKEMFGMSIGGYTVTVLVAAFVSSIYSILMMYASMSIGQLFNKYKVLASFVAYAIINFVVNIIVTIVQIPAFKFTFEGALTGSSDISSFFSYTIWSSVGTCAVLAVVFAFVTEYITRKKLNLD